MLLQRLFQRSKTDSAVWDPSAVYAARDDKSARGAQFGFHRIPNFI